LYGAGHNVIKYSRDSFTAPRPLLEPQLLSFQPDDVVPAADGTLLLLSSLNRSVFRWDSQSQDYLPTIHLYDQPAQFSYSQKLNTAFLAYRSGLVSKIDLDADEPREQLLGMLDYDIRILATDDFLLAFPPPSAYDRYLAAYDANLNPVQRRSFYKTPT